MRTLYEVQNMFNSLRMKRIVRIRNKYNQAIQYEHRKRSTYYAQNQRKQEPRQIWYRVPDRREAVCHSDSYRRGRGNPEGYRREKSQPKAKKSELKSTEKEVAKLEAKKAEADQKAAEEAKKAEAEAVVKKLLAGGMSADEILEKLK